MKPMDKFPPCVIFCFLIAAEVLYSQNQIVPFAVGNQWIYQVHEYYNGMTGSKDTLYFDTVSVLHSIKNGNDTIWVLSNGNEFVIHNDSIFNISSGTTYLKYIPVNKSPAVLPNGTIVSLITDSIKTPFGNYISGVSYQLSMLGESGGWTYNEIIVPGIGVIIDSTLTTWPEYVGAIVQHLVSYTQKVLSVQDEIIADNYFLSQNYPNPFNPTTKINYQLPISSFVTLNIFDVLGREVATLVNEQKQPGMYEVTWNAGDIASGIYFYQLHMGEFIQTKKLAIQK